MGKFTTEYFIERSREKYGDLFTYDKTIYVGAHKNVIITCKKHGDFEQTPALHLASRTKYGCTQCFQERIEAKVDTSKPFTKNCNNPDCPEDNPQPHTNFHKSKNNINGRSYYCKTCRKQQQAEYYNRKRSTIRKQQSGYYRDNIESILKNKIKQYRKQIGITDEEWEQREAERQKIKDEVDRLVKLRKDLREQRKEYNQELYAARTMLLKYDIKVNEYLYVIKEEDTDYYKIGITKSLKNRKSGIKTSNAHPLVTLIHKQCIYPKVMESKFHDHFKDKNIDGEWFRLSIEDVTFIETMLDNTDEEDERKDLEESIEWYENTIAELQAQHDEYSRELYGDDADKIIERECFHL